MLKKRKGENKPKSRHMTKHASDAILTQGKSFTANTPQNK